MEAASETRGERSMRLEPGRVIFTSCGGGILVVVGVKGYRGVFMEGGYGGQCPSPTMAPPGSLSHIRCEHRGHTGDLCAVYTRHLAPTPSFRGC
jgi:hypothetical protein